MGPELGEIAAGWPFAASVAAAAAARGVRASRRRRAVNEALHELRRPLQALALTRPGRGAGDDDVDDSLRSATEALEHLDRAVNGGRSEPQREPFRVLPLLDETLARWTRRAELAGGSLTLERRVADPVLIGDRAALVGALDNLVVNALNHGGPHVVISAAERDGALRLVVSDSGHRAEHGWARSPRSRDRRRHGHGLRIVRRVAAAHGGRFELRRTTSGTEAVLELSVPGWLATR